MAVALFAALPLAAQEPDDCDQSFGGSYRAAVKNRTPSQPSYTRHNQGRPISVSEWYGFCQGLDRELANRRATKPRTNTPAMKGLETVEVTVRAYVVGVKYERSGDHDFHVEIAGAPQWQGDHIVVEVPPGPTFCNPRQAVWSLVKADAQRAGVSVTDRYKLRRPVQVDVRGFVFLDGTHARKGTSHYADAIGKDAGRGIEPRQVRGLWEVHPVIEVRRV